MTLQAIICLTFSDDHLTITAVHVPFKQTCAAVTSRYSQIAPSRLELCDPIAAFRLP